jgi:N-acetylmuramoyl-L-alanine amidase
MARFSCATWRPISVNMGGNITNNLGLVLHHQAGNGSLFNFFNRASSSVSAHFWISKTGVIEQYVDTSRVAWHGRSLNSRYVGVETEGCPVSPWAEPMTDAMFNALVRLYREGRDRHGWINALANKDGQRGFGYHRMAVATGCPCDVRLNRRQAILNAAFGGTPSPEPPVVPEVPQPPPFISWEEDMIIRTNNVVRQLIYAGQETYWRELPANAVARIPASMIIADDGSLLALWRTTPLST